MVKRVIRGVAPVKKTPTAMDRAVASLPAATRTALKSVVLDKPTEAPLPPRRRASAPQVKAEAPTKVGGTYMDHGLKTTYDGPSGVTNNAKSRTPVRLDLFNSLIGSALTARDEAAIKSLHETYGGGVFARGNLDTGILRRLGERGMLAHVKGSDVDPATTFKLTRTAINHVSA